MSEVFVPYFFDLIASFSSCNLQACREGNDGVAEFMLQKIIGKSSQSASEIDHLHHTSRKRTPSVLAATPRCASSCKLNSYVIV